MSARPRRARPRLPPADVRRLRIDRRAPEPRAARVIGDRRRPLARGQVVAKRPATPRPPPRSCPRARAHRPADLARDRSHVRVQLADRLDVVHPRQPRSSDSRAPVGSPGAARSPHRSVSWTGAGSSSRTPSAAIGIASIVVIALAAVWVTVQPLRSSDANSAALDRGDPWKRRRGAHRRARRGGR